MEYISLYVYIRNTPSDTEKLAVPAEYEQKNQIPRKEYIEP